MISQFGGGLSVDGVITGLVILTTVIAAIYLLVINTSYITLTAIAIRQLRRQMRLNTYNPVGELGGNQFLPGIAVTVPAYNEQEVIVESINSLRSLAYPNYEIIIVNDGSTDETADRLLAAFDFTEIEAEYPIALHCECVESIYRASDDNLVLINKENGGKADALNAGLQFTNMPLFCTVDADSMIERGALADVANPFLTHPDETVISGGAIRISNGCTFRNGALQSVSLPRSSLIRFQAVEYLRAFLLGRIGLSNLNSLLIVSGAFSLFRTDVLREIGGYDTESITEDMEIVVRLHRYLREQERDYRAVFLPRPVAWTEAPESLTVLSRQRRRWFRGMLQTLVRHRDAIGRRQYGVIGLFALPFYLFIETIGTLVEGLGYVIVPFFFLAGVIGFEFFAAFLLIALGLGSLLTVFAVFGEVVTYRRYEKPREVLVLLCYAIIENATYRPWRTFVRCWATGEYIAGDRSWGKMTRTGAANNTDSDERT